MNPEYKKCYNNCLRLLSKRDYSRHKLSEKLVGRGFERSLVDEIINEFEEERLFREEFYTDARIRGLMRKNYSPYLIRLRLTEEKISVSEDYILNIFRENQYTIARQVKELVEKKARGIDFESLEFKERLRTYDKIKRFLLSKGHVINNINDYLKSEEFNDHNQI